MDEDWIFVQPSDYGSTEKTLQQPIKRLKYEPLKDQENFIRVLVILPREKSSVLICRLLQADLRKYDEFEALSYTWGNPIALNASLPQLSPLQQSRTAWGASARDGHVFVNGVRVGIGANLYAALDRIALPNLRRVVWVDALCIDQANLEERNRQVAIMHKVYQTAKRVLVWLGPHEDIWKQWPKLKVEKWLLPAFSALSSSWFQRIWVIQEAVMARDISLLIGSTEVPIGYLEKLNFRSLKAQGTKTEGQIWSEALKTSTFIAALRDNSKGLDLKDVVISARNKHCQDPRDRIYGLLSLARSTMGGKRLLTPDYKLSLSQVHLQATYCSIVGYNNLKILLHVWNRDFTIHRPSWVPMWDELNKVLEPSSEWIEGTDEAPPSYLGRSAKELPVRLMGPSARVLDVPWPLPGPEPGLDCLSLPADIFLEISQEQDLVFNFKSRMTDCLTDSQRDSKGPLEIYLGKKDRGFAICRGPSSVHELRARLYFTDTVLKPLAESDLERTWIETKKPQNLWRWCEDTSYCECSLNGALPGHRFLKRDRGQIHANWPSDLIFDAKKDLFKVAVTRQDVFTFVPKSTRPGDFVALLHGIRTPFVVRKALDVDSTRAFELVGPCYIESKVDWGDFEAQKDRLGWIELV